MAEAKKVEPASGWPLSSGDYVIGDPKGCVAVCTLSSEKIVSGVAKIPGVVIAGSCKTENIGIEKAVTNIISNPNVRFLLICGIEVTGHVTGGCLKAIWEKGVDPSSKKIKEAPGAIPFIEHLPQDAVERFQKQVKTEDLISVEDEAKIRAKVEELVRQDPGAYLEPPFIVKIEEKKEVKAGMVAIPLASVVEPSITTLTMLVDDIAAKVQLIGRERRLNTAVGITRWMGILSGLAISLGILTLLLLVILRVGV